MKSREFVTLIKQTGKWEMIENVKNLYQTLAKREKTFCEAFDVHCKACCGSCCECFNPDITDAEATYLAYGIIKENKEEQVLAKCKDYRGKACPLYAKDIFCSLYPYRPLICRLFNCAVSNGKNGEPQFRHCKWSGEIGEIPSTELQKQRRKLVSMEEFGMRMDECNHETESTALIQDILPEKIEHLLYLCDNLKNNT